MASSNKTPNYNLPQYAEDDTIEFTPEINNAFSTIDAGMKANADNIGLLKADTAPYFLWADTSKSWQTILQERYASLPANRIVNIRIQHSGAYMDLIGSRTNDLYGSFLAFSYGTTGITHARNANGTWMFQAV